jgi:hypothetical protein
MAQSWPQALRVHTRPLLHWKYSSVFIPLFFATGITMALANQFVMAYVFFLLFGSWSIAYWLTSDWLDKKSKSLKARTTRRNPELFQAESRKYRAYAWGVSLSLALIAAGFTWWTVSIKHKYERDDVFQHLTVSHSLQPGTEDDPMHSMFSVANGGSIALSKHWIVCYTNLAVGNGGRSGIVKSPSVIIDGHAVIGDDVEPAIRVAHQNALRASGDEETDPCLNYFNFHEGTDCADVTVMFKYELETQPNIEQEKRFRFVAYKGSNGTFSWYGEPVNEEFSRCSQFLKADWHQLLEFEGTHSRRSSKTSH